MRTICTVVGVAAAFLLAAAQASAAPTEPDSASAPISDSELDGMRGGEATSALPVSGTVSSLPIGSTVLTSQTASDGNNVVSAGGNVSSGNVNLGQDAFQNFSGIGNFVINTGHNNNLLGSLSVAINMMQTAATGNSVQ